MEQKNAKNSTYTIALSHYIFFKKHPRKSLHCSICHHVEKSVSKSGAEGKIYVVVAVVAVILTGIFIYLFRTEARLKKLEKASA